MTHLSVDQQVWIWALWTGVQGLLKNKNSYLMIPGVLWLQKKPNAAVLFILTMFKDFYLVLDKDFRGF